MKFFTYFMPLERCVLAQVCKTWETLLYSDQRFWKHLMPVILCNELRREKSLPTLPESVGNTRNQMDVTNHMAVDGEDNNNTLVVTTNDKTIEEIKANLYYSIDIRGFDSICMFGASDGDIVDFTARTRPSLLNRLASVA
ncbi:unnamed protein product, partial [Medioppia subpectinata]